MLNGIIDKYLSIRDWISGDGHNLPGLNGRTHVYIAALEMIVLIFLLYQRDPGLFQSVSRDL